MNQVKTGKQFGCSGRVCSSCSTCVPIMLLLAYVTSHIRKLQLVLFTVNLVMGVAKEINSAYIDVHKQNKYTSILNNDFAYHKECTF